MDNNYMTISISRKRQITIPERFFSRFQFSSRAKVFALENGIFIQPAEYVSNGEFDEQILQDLVEQGISSQELMDAFKDSKAKIRPAIEAMLLNAKEIAHDEAEFDTVENVFGDD